MKYIPVPITNTEYYRNWLLTTQRQRNRWEMMLTFSRHHWNIADECHKIKCPVLMIYGENDTLVPLETGIKIYRAIGLEKNVEILIFPDCGHFPHL